MKKIISIVGLSLVAMASHAGVAFNTFGPGDSTATFGWGFGDIRDTRVASQFTSSLTGTLDSIELRTQSSSGTGIATVSLFEDSGNDIGTLITTFTVNVAATGMKTLTNSNPSIQLVTGNKYWIEAKSAPGSGVYSGWFRNDRGINGLLKFGQVGSAPNSTYSVGTGALPAFRVNVTPVPEPSTLLAMGAFASMAALRRRRKG